LRVSCLSFAIDDGLRAVVEYRRSVLQKEESMEKKVKLLIKREVLRELKPAELTPVVGGGSRGTDVSNCCCDPCQMSASCPPPP
jgi:hypothetical protein